MKLFKKTGLKKYTEINQNSFSDYPSWPVDGIILAYSGFIVIFEKNYLKKYSLIDLIKSSFIFYFLEQHLLNHNIYSLFTSQESKIIAFDFLRNFNLKNHSIQSDYFFNYEKESFNYYTFNGKKYNFYGTTFKGFNKPGLWLVNDAKTNDIIFLTDGNDFDFSLNITNDRLSSIFDDCINDFKNCSNREILKEFIFKILLDNQK